MVPSSFKKPGCLVDCPRGPTWDQALFVPVFRMLPGDVIYNSLGWHGDLDKCILLLDSNPNLEQYTFWFMGKREWHHWKCDWNLAFRLPFSDDLWVRDGKILARGPDNSHRPGMKGPTIFDDDL